MGLSIAPIRRNDQGRPADLGNDAVAPIEQKGAVEYLSPISDGCKAMRAWRKPKKYKTPDDLQRALAAYLDSLQDPDGLWIKPPTLSGAGIFLGFNSKSWHEPYSKDAAFKPTIDWLKFFVEAWREEQVLMPSKGVYPQGLMFLMNRLDAAEAAENARNATPAEAEVDTPSEVTALIEGLWRKSDDGHAIEASRTAEAKSELDKLSRMTPHEKLIWHKAKQVEAEAAIDDKPEATPLWHLSGAAGMTG